MKVAVTAVSCLVFALSVHAASAADGKGCTKTSVSCYDKKNNQARTCITETCTFANGTTTTSVTVEMVGGSGGNAGPKRPLLEKAPTATIQQ
jgi:5-hydroxyisourate hydrolase-like protein (transthyretin family)